MNNTAKRPAEPTTLQVHEELVAAATALIPTLRSRSAQTARLAKLPEATIADLQAARLFDMMKPKIYGGLQTPLRTLMDVVVQLARGDGSVAWNVNLLSGGIWMAAALFPKSVGDVVFAPGSNFRVANSFSLRNAKTRRVDGGIVIEEGFWSFNSGVDHAGWDVLAIPVVDDAGDVVDRACALVPTSELVLLNDWNATGLRGSGSMNVAVNSLFVPDERLITFSDSLKENYGASHLDGEPLYQMPLVALMVTRLVSPALGMAKAALDLFLEKAAHRGIAYTPYSRQNEAPVTHLQVAEASVKIDMAEMLLQRATDLLDSGATTGRVLPASERVRIRRDTSYANRLVFEAMEILGNASGGSFASVENGMNRIWQDVRVASLHGGINPETAMELFGRVLCGLPPNTPLI